jgi:hypothetical protein
MKPPCFECITLPMCRSKYYKGIIGIIPHKELFKCSLLKDYIFSNGKLVENNVGKVETILKAWILWSK